MLARNLALTCALLLGFGASAGAQTPPAVPAPQPASPPPATAPAAAAPAAPAPVPAATPVRIRGTITAARPDHLTIKSRTGETLEVILVRPVTVMTVRRVPLDSIKDNAYLGIASRGGPNGTRIALEVLVFPDKMRGAGAGNYGWDLQPGSMMTNAPVTGIATQRSGRDLTLTYQGGSVVIHVPPRVPVVTLVPASASDLKRGRRVFLAAQKGADGRLSATRVTIGTHGVNPPM